MKKALLRCQSGLIEVSNDGRARLPQDVYKRLESRLQYIHKSYVRTAYNPHTGNRERFIQQRVAMYMYDSRKFLCCLRGFMPAVLKILRDFGYEVTIRELDPPKPEKYEPDWDRLVSMFSFRPKQDECLAAIVSQIADLHAVGGGIIDAPPAFGKMYVIAMISVLYSKAEIDIVCKNLEVVKSIRELLFQYLPRVGQFGG